MALSVLDAGLAQYVLCGISYSPRNIFSRSGMGNLDRYSEWREHAIGEGNVFYFFFLMVFKLYLN